MHRIQQALIIGLMFSALFPMRSMATPPDSRGLQFLPFKSFMAFTATSGSNLDETVLPSPEIQTRLRRIDAWEYTKNAVYLVCPMNTPLPCDELGPWEALTENG